MSLPKRYDGINGSISVKETWYGAYVRWDDYARLKAEVERLRSVVRSYVLNEECGTCCDASAEVERLTKAIESSSYYFLSIKLNAEVNRLTKAGDAMAKLLSCCGNPQSEVRGWNAAKEGKQP